MKDWAQYFDKMEKEKIENKKRADFIGLFLFLMIILIPILYFVTY